MLPFTLSSFLALVTFVFVAAMTPGPNNAMLMASGANFGLRRTAPHMLGVIVGYWILLGAIGLGLGAVFTAVPVMHVVLRWGGAAYLLWLAWKIGTSRGLGGKATTRPLTFVQALAFQWINPKGWIGAVGAVSVYAPQDRYFAGLAVIVAVSLVFTVLSAATWTTLGAYLRRFLETPGRLRLFNAVMALLLIGAIIPIAFEP